MDLYTLSTKKSARNAQGGYNAFGKAPSDIASIIESNYSFKSVELRYLYIKNRFFGPLLRTIYSYIQAFKYCNKPKIMQYPDCIFAPSFAYRNTYVAIIHDLNGLRMADHFLEKWELHLLKKCKCLISHNETMTSYLVSKGIKRERIVNLEIFDYLADPFDYKEQKIEGLPTIAFAGNLAKTAFLKKLDPERMNFTLRLYGLGGDFKPNSKMVYMGKETPEKLPGILDANLGLVWDGDIDIEGKANNLKDYLRYNNPHKTSCYLASGIPVIIWKESALAPFIKENDCGYLIDSVYDINNLDLSDYEKKRDNARKIGGRLKEGYYTKKALDNAFKILNIEVDRK